MVCIDTTAASKQEVHTSRSHAPSSADFAKKQEEWKQYLQETIRTRISSKREFDLWKQQLWDELNSTKVSLQRMSASPAKANLLNSMLARIEEIRQSATGETLEGYTQDLEDYCESHVALSEQAPSSQEQEDTEDMRDYIEWIKQKQRNATARLNT